MSRVLAERLKVMLPKLISNHQSAALIKGMQILDRILVSNEGFDSSLKQGIPAFVCKVYLEKSFDNVKWYFSNGGH